MAFADQTESVLAACRDAFGESVSYTPAGGSLATITAVFELQGAIFDPSTGLIVRTGKPTLAVKISDLASPPARKDAVTARGVNYTVTDVDPDGHGGALLTLQKT